MSTTTNVTIPNTVNPLDGYIPNNYQNANYQSNLYSNMSSVLNNGIGMLATTGGAFNSTAMVASGSAAVSALYTQAEADLAAAMAGDEGAKLRFQWDSEQARSMHDAISNAFKSMHDAGNNSIANVR